MGINACILSWFEDITLAGHLDGLSSALELGPQDFFFPPQALSQAAARLWLKTGTDVSPATMAAFIVDPANPYEDRMKAFYGLFGLSSYASVDTYDERATYRQELNFASAAPRSFDLLVDCGTTEHVFNLANVFIYTHNTLPVGGVSLKVLPTFGDNTHGFYNIHPTVYFDIARVNGYEILDFRYVDNMTRRTLAQGADSFIPQKRWTTDLLSFAGCAGLQSQVSERFLQTLESSRQEGRLGDGHNAVDYCFVAMRKCVEAPFRYPGQGVYLNEFPPEAHQASEVAT